MSSLFDILDTAVKIGLGAAISGTATYFTTKAKSDKDRTNEIEKHRRELLERVATSAKGAAGSLSNAMDCLNRSDANDSDKISLQAEARALALKAVEALTSARGAAALLADKQLTEQLLKYSDATRSIYYLLRNNPEDSYALDMAVDAVNSAEPALDDAIGQTYARGISAR